MVFGNGNGKKQKTKFLCMYSSASWILLVLTLDRRFVLLPDLQKFDSGSSPRHL